MQPYSDAAIGAHLLPQGKDIESGGRLYRAYCGPGEGFVRETGPDGKHDYAIAQVLGGKNVYYFLTPLERGRLQTLPVAFDVRGRQWFAVAASTARHGPHFRAGGHEGLSWRDPAYTFNTSCHACHVSQLSANYDAATDTYSTTWREPGINCETCHGPSQAHNDACLAAQPGNQPADLKIIRIKKDLTRQQRDDSCAACHAKMSPITDAFRPGERFFDHFDLILLENDDYYPDGRDLGENFTFTSWLAAPCVQAGKLECIFCHTSSGRFRQAKDPDQACLPCHKDKQAGLDKHTRHKPESPGSRCISCHMPKTDFARMARSDHSMRPPAPAATASFGSPNACQGCHTNKDAAWADAHVRQWRSRDYQAPVLARARLIQSARQRNFSQLPAMLASLTAPKQDPVYAASLLRLLRACPDDTKWPVVRAALNDESELVRASAAASLTENREPVTLAALGKACADQSRLVRVRAAEALAGVQDKQIPEPLQQAVARARAELAESFSVRADDWTGSYNRGNYLLRSGDFAAALTAYEAALRLRPDAGAAHVNAAMAQARMGNMAGAETSLRKARAIDPGNAATAYNLGLVLAERGLRAEAADQLLAALRLAPTMSEAAYNLGMLTAPTDPEKSLQFLCQAARLQPENPRYAKALGQFSRNGSADGVCAKIPYKK
ncbi:ammonia-forming cytochrome c nitrite reductase subunit c552 [Desulfovibrio desulfuricans]|uniref:ammonia-forming cytochrome c nitrite reductase subunit c552 n=1 Tax=Desulfovibrio desulfuricans TaxID=876 RepID=UPI0035B1B8A6